MPKPLLRLSLLLCLAAAAGLAQRIDAVRNGARSFDSSLGEHTIATIFGENLAAAECLAESLPLPTTMCGGSAVLKKKGLSHIFLVPLFYVSPTQWNVQLPIGLFPRGSTWGDVEFCIGSACRAIRIEPAAPGIFEWAPESGPSIAVVTRPDGTLVTPEAPARDGEILILYATGLGLEPGAITPSDGYFVSLPYVAEYSLLHTFLWAKDELIGAPSVQQEILFAGLTPGFVGLAQINFRLRKTFDGVGPLPSGDVQIFIVKGFRGHPADELYQGGAAFLPVE